MFFFVALWDAWICQFLESRFDTAISNALYFSFAFASFT